MLPMFVCYLSLRFDVTLPIAKNSNVYAGRYACDVSNTRFNGMPGGERHSPEWPFPRFGHLPRSQISRRFRAFTPLSLLAQRLG